TKYSFHFLINTSYMRSLFFSLVLLIVGTGLFAQKLDRAKDYLGKNRLTDARTEIDNYLAIEKNQDKAEAWYVKGKVYSTIASDSVAQAGVPDAKVISFEALKKYLEMESHVKDS